MDVTVVVATYGDQKWVDLANERAIPSAEALGVPIVSSHGTSLQFARNAGLMQVETPWVCHLDADDELEPGYFEAMQAAADQLHNGNVACVIAPSVRYVEDGNLDVDPIMPRVVNHAHTCTAACLTAGNWIVVGAVASTRSLKELGGWRDFPWSEDWDLWLRCHLAGVTIAAAPDAIYRAHVRSDSRNRAPDQAARTAAHLSILRANGLAR